MKIFFAGRVPYSDGGNDFFGMKHYLATYMDLRDRTVLAEFLGYFKDKKLDLFLDSGAFSVMTVGIKVNLNEYISFINRYGHLFYPIASLDAIGSAEKSHSNYIDILEHIKKSLINRIIPTFHYREPFDYLDTYCNMSDYIAIGGMTDITMAERVEYTKKVVTRARKIRPDIRVHVFGLGRMPTIKKLAEYADSVDTTDWLYPLKYAKVRNRPKFEKNQVNRHQLIPFLRHEVGLFYQLENNINEWVHKKINEDRDQKELEDGIKSFNPPNAFSKIS